MSEEITEAKFWRDRFYQVSIMNEKSMEIIKLLMDRANKKEWVGLTIEDYAEVNPDNQKAFILGARWAEAKLREKNESSPD
jgi:hypothetical protein